MSYFYFLWAKDLLLNCDFYSSGVHRAHVCVKVILWHALQRRNGRKNAILACSKSSIEMLP